MDPTIDAWTHVNPLVVARLFLIQGMLEKKIDHALEASSHGGIVRRQSYLWIDWFWESFRKNLLPVA